MSVGNHTLWRLVVRHLTTFWFKKLKETLWCYSARCPDVVEIWRNVRRWRSFRWHRPKVRKEGGGGGERCIRWGLRSDRKCVCSWSSWRGVLMFCYCTEQFDREEVVIRTFESFTSEPDGFKHKFDARWFNPQIIKLQLLVSVQCGNESKFNKSVGVTEDNPAADQQENRIPVKPLKPGEVSSRGSDPRATAAGTTASGPGHTPVWCWWRCTAPRWWSAPVWTPPGNAGWSAPPPGPP